jgi:hypothetical protein
VTQQTRLGRVPETGSKISVAAGSDSIVRPLAASALVRAEVGRILARVDAAQLGRRIAQDALGEAVACTWTRRAELLTWAMSRPGDFTGNATPAEIAERDRKLAAQAEACRHASELYQGRLLDFEAS